MVKSDLTLRLDKGTPLTFNEHDANIKRLMYWSGEWASGSYEANEVVRDGDWTMIANKDTTDQAAPQSIGPPAYTLPDTPTWNSQSNVSQVLSGLRITNILEMYHVNKIRVWIPNLSASVQYRTQIEDLITGDVRLGAVFTGDSVTSIGWIESNLSGNAYLVPGDEVEVSLIALNSSATTQFSGNWNYSSLGQDGIPIAGEAFERTNRTYLRFNKTDADAGDRSTELASVITGTVITAGTQTWEVIAEIDGGTFIEYEIIRTGSVIIDGLYSFNFVVPTPAATDYVDITNQWATTPLINALAKGVLQFDNDTPVLNDNAYGVDIEAEQYEASPDWDLVSYSG